MKNFQCLATCGLIQANPNPSLASKCTSSLTHFASSPLRDQQEGGRRGRDHPGDPSDGRRWSRWLHRDSLRHACVDQCVGAALVRGVPSSVLQELVSTMNLSMDWKRLAVASLKEEVMSTTNCAPLRSVRWYRSWRSSAPLNSQRRLRCVCCEEQMPCSADHVLNVVVEMQKKVGAPLCKLPLRGSSCANTFCEPFRPP